MSILFVDACVREESRTRRLARHVLEKLGGAAETLSLEAERIPALDGETLRRREEMVRERAFEEPYFRYARQFAAAEEIVVAAPYWDLSFPANLKAYFEAINIVGLTFEYDGRGMPRGLCRARRLIYVTTAGGPIVSDEPGYGYIRLLSTGFYGIKDTLCVKAEGLDIVGADVEAILRRSFERADALLEAE